MAEELTKPETEASPEQATLGGGCFWCLEAVYKRARGITRIQSGYAGGQVEHPTYRQICAGDTGHAEVIQVTFDPNLISYEQVLDLFWIAHDPTTLNRQGPDAGTQYRSIILTHSEAQQAAAEASRAQAADDSKPPIVTEIEPLKVFYPAEDHHQDYYDRNSTAGYCVYVIQPKIDKLIGNGVIEDPD